MVSPRPSRWLGLVLRLHRVQRWFELTNATWLASSLFPEPDRLLPVAVASFPRPFLSPGVTIVTLTGSTPNGTRDRKMRGTISVMSHTSHKREFLRRRALGLALRFSESLSFQLLFPPPGMSFDYFDLLVKSYLSTGEPAHLYPPLCSLPRCFPPRCSSRCIAQRSVSPCRLPERFVGKGLVSFKGPEVPFYTEHRSAFVGRARGVVFSPRMYWEATPPSMYKRHQK